MTGSETMMPVAVLAGGLAKRMRPVTETIPKSLLEVAGEPFVNHQLRLFAREGIRDVVMLIGHLGERIIEHVGDGSRFGIRVRYQPDGDRLLGTGGALRNALPLLGDQFFVTYGDSYLDIDYRPVAAAFKAAGLPALMTIFANHGRWDTSNVLFRDGRIVRYSKKNRQPDMAYIDYGLLAVSAAALSDIPLDTAFDLEELLSPMSERGELAGLEITKRFYEIGSPQGLAETDAYLRGP